MSKRALILVEGQTEERVVKDVLAPHFAPSECYLTPVILTTKVVKNGPNFKGGVGSFGKFEADLRRLLGGAGPNTLVTTIVDYYRLPTDFPGMNDRPSPAPARARAQHVEQALAAHFGDGRLIPFLALHEIEAWLFACPITLPQVMAQPAAAATTFASICNGPTPPEQINDRPGQNPASRILQVFATYRKTLHGPTALTRIGLTTIRNRCPHFDEWVTRLEAYASS